MCIEGKVDSEKCDPFRDTERVGWGWGGREKRGGTDRQAYRVSGKERW